MSDIKVVPIEQVAAITLSHRVFVQRMIKILHKQGQIEPLQVREIEPNSYLTYEQDAHGSDILAAAKLAGWKDILIVVNAKYEY